tara:strand:+ start:2253 stop:2699 length:447 start_codon:yes stop_codon:yes gene_type:complete
MKKYDIMLLSGGFDPVHKGHIECIQNALNYANEIWIGVNNDKWLENKKGKIFMGERERAFIMSNIKGVSWTYIMDPPDPNDKTATDFIMAAIRRRPYGSLAFGNGGDRVENNVPTSEESLCRENGIDMVWGLGDKVQSSSWLLENYKE